MAKRAVGVALALLVASVCWSVESVAGAPGDDGIVDLRPPDRAAMSRSKDGVELASGALRRAVAMAERAGAAVPAVETVELVHEPGVRSLGQVVAAVGGRVLGAADGELTLAEIHLDRLVEVEAHVDVRYVRLPGGAPPPQGATAAITGEEVRSTNAANWHAVGRTGAGVKVGIIDRFDGTLWSVARGRHDVPTPRATFCRSQGQGCDIWAGGGDGRHGVAVAEVIHEVAPGAPLYLATVGGSAADLRAAIDWFAANGVRVVNRSLGGTYDGPGDGSGPYGAVASYAVRRGIAFFNSAGNHANAPSSSGGLYVRFTAADVDADRWIEFPGGSELLELRCAGMWFGGLRWSDWPAGAGTTDYDVYVYDTVEAAAAHQPERSGEDAQGGTSGGDPLELPATSCSARGDVDYIAVWRFDAHGGTVGDMLEIQTNDPLGRSTNAYSAAQPIGDSADPGVFSIGAVTATATAASYSSRGPNNAERLKPDFTARSHMTNGAYGVFTGTSAASPTAVGLAALVIGARLASTPAKLRTWLRANAAVDRGPSGPDTTYGMGELVLPRLTAPSPPRQLRAAPYARAVVVRWTAPASTGGLRVTDYRIQRSANRGRTWARVRDPVSTARSLAVRGLQPDRRYSFRVAAVNAAGQSRWSAAISTRTRQ